MSNTTLGQKIGNLRREKNLTQEELAERLGVSAQAVSKWENDVSCPDIMLLPKLAKLFNVTTDNLLGCEPEMPVQLVPKEKRKSYEDMVLRILVNSSDGDKVKVNLPMTLVKAGVEMGINMSQLSGNESLGKEINFEQMMKLVDKGLVGKLLEIESGDGDLVEIIVEDNLSGGVKEYENNNM